MIGEEKKTLHYTGTNIIIYYLKERSRINAENSRRRGRSVGKRSKGSFPERTERAKEENEVVRGYLPKVLASYMKRYQANGIFRAFLGIQYYIESS